MKRTILYVMVFLLLIAGGYCGYRYYLDVIQPEQQIAAADEKQNAVFERVKPDIPADSDTGLSAEYAAEWLAPAAEVNKSTNAWLTIPGTHIDYPVVQGEDNDFYLHHGFDGELNQELGCPFLDCRCRSDYSGFNSIVYAHHMTKQRMFADIALFKYSEFMKRCPKGILTTTGGQYSVRFFAYLTVPSNDAVYNVVCEDFEKREKYIAHLTESAVYTYGVTTEDLQNEENLHLLLLSTCTYEYDKARGVLVGVIE